ncbi:MAG: VOC family protein [Flavobacteriaceae bacterium]
MREERTINGIQQIGIGVANARAVFNWYRKHFGFDILVFEDESSAKLMTRYTKGNVRKRYALLALNMIGGGGLEIWQFKDRVPQPPGTDILLGDLGINVMKLRSKAIEKAHASTAGQQLNLVTKIYTEVGKKSGFFLMDPWNNLVQIVEDNYCYCDSKSNTGGVLGVIIGVSDMKASLFFYTELLGYNETVSDTTAVFKDFKDLPGGENSFRRVLLKRSTKKVGGFGELLGPSEIELVQVLDRSPNKIYKDRIWGDLGYIHLCFDVHGMNALRRDAKMLNHSFTVDSSDSFDMGDAAGHFSYVEDPDGTLIEFVETHKVPISKKLGLYINLKNRDPHKPLSKWLVKAMQLHRVKKDLN